MTFDFWSNTAVTMGVTAIVTAAPVLSFWKSMDAPLADEPIARAVSADLNHDGVPDLIASTPGSGTVRVALGRGAGVFAAPVSYVVSPGIGHLAVDDLNNDAHPDVIVAATGIAVLLGIGDGTFEPPVFSAGSAKDVVAADFDADGHVDIASVGRNSASVVPETVDLYPGRGDGTFGAPATVLVTDRHPGALAVADFNGDGWPDLAFGERDIRHLRVLLNTGGLTFAHASLTFIEVGPSRTATADLDANGTADVVTVNFVGTVSVLLGNGDGTLQAARTYGAGDAACARKGCPIARWAELADVDGDHRLDIITANDGPGSASILLNLGDGTFGEPVVLDAGIYGDASLAIDVNDDQATDVLVVSSNVAHTAPGPRLISVFLNRAGSKGRDAGTARGAATGRPIGVPAQPLEPGGRSQGR